MEFDHKRYKVYTWKNGMMLHWIINPGLAINELLLGQRVPKVSLEDLTLDKPRFERGFVPCPHCGKVHDGRTWSTQNGTAFKNWFGLYCPDCGNIIPCLMNATSFLILAVTSPIWYWFRNPLKAAWLKAQPARFQNLKFEDIKNPFQNFNWIKMGLSWGAFMLLFIQVIVPLVTREPITWKGIAVGIPVWTVAGLAFGYGMKRYLGKYTRAQPPAN